eukprot:SAG31_NODE_28887_length_404_cov_0.567213_1_plen_38_part_01
MSIRVTVDTVAIPNGSPERARFEDAFATEAILRITDII